MGIYARKDGEWYSVGEGGSGGLSWGDFTTNGDETTSDTWGPDANGRMWKWAEWDVANDYTVNLSGGMYWVLTVGGGSRGWNPSTDGHVAQGQPGQVREGYWEFGSGTQKVTVGQQGTGTQATSVGGGSSIGDFKVFSSFWGSSNGGRGSDTNETPTPYYSHITGGSLGYGPGWAWRNADQGNELRPGSGGEGVTPNEPTSGCVIIATAAPNAKALNWVHTTYHAEVNDGTVTAVYTQKHYADGKTTPLPTGELVEASYGVSEGWLFVNGELQPPPTPPEPTRDELIAELQARIVELQNNTK